MRVSATCECFRALVYLWSITNVSHSCDAAYQYAWKKVQKYYNPLVSLVVDVLAHNA